MGTSISLSPGSGGNWTVLKTQITSYFTGSRPSSAAGIVRDTINAVGGVGAGSREGIPRLAPGGGRTRIIGTSTIGTIISGLGAFSNEVQDAGLLRGLTKLGLSELEGKSAVEVIASIAEHLSLSVDGLDAELLRDALRDSILEASSLEVSDGFTDLEQGLQHFINENGPVGLIEIFLCHLVFDAIWSNIEEYAQAKSSDENGLNAFMSAIEGVCDAEIRRVINEMRNDGSFAEIDWFGRDGKRIGKAIFNNIDQHLRRLTD
jgi:hypothetical protein